MKILKTLRDGCVRFAGLFRRRQHEAEMNEELRAHLDGLIERNVAAGMSPDEARYAALRAFGGVAQIEERSRDERRLVGLEHIFRDLRHAFRQLIKARVFTGTIILTLALGIGSCVTIYSFVQSVLLDGFGEQAARRTAFVQTRAPNPAPLEVPTGDFCAWRELKSFDQFVGYSRATHTLSGQGEPLRVDARYVSDGYLFFFETRFIIGRDFSSADHSPANHRLVVLTSGFWRRAFGGRNDIVGQTIALDGQPFTVIGVADPGVRAGGADFDIFVPAWLHPAAATNHSGRAFTCFGRLRGGVTISEAQAELDVVAARLTAEFPEAKKGFATRLVPLRDLLTRETRPALWTLFAAVVCVLLIACANVANLLLARATARRRELAIRAALGASQGRLARQLFAESILLAIFGGGAGVLLAHFTLHALRSYRVVLALRDAAFAIDGRMLFFALAFTVLTAVMFGLAPAWIGSSANVNDALTPAGRGNSATGGRGRLRHALVMTEVACAVVLLTTAGLLVRSYLKLSAIDSGLVATNACVMGVALPGGPKYSRPEQRQAFVDNVLARMLAVPGVQAAGITQFLPFAYTAVNTRVLAIEGRPVTDEASKPRMKLATVSPGYFPAAGVRLLRGRLFTDDDKLDNPRVAIVNETFARQFYPHEGALGRRIGVDGKENVWCEIVGVVGDATQSSPELPVTPQAYQPYAQQPGPWMNFVVRASGDVQALASVLKAQVHAVDPDQPIGPFRLLQEVLDERVNEKRFELHLLTAFSLLALIIATVGIYGLIAYSVGQRTLEIGIRMALGAKPREVLQLVLSQAARVVGFGMIIGVGISLVVGRLIEARLFRMSPHDPLTVAAIIAIFASVAGFACWLPARRATKIDPLTALRAE